MALGSLGGALTALENGVVDATAMPLILFRTRGGASKYRDSGRSAGPAAAAAAARHRDRQGDEGVTRKSCARSRPARVEGTRFIYQHTDEAIEILSKVYEPLPPAEVASMVKELVAVEVLERGPHRDGRCCRTPCVP